MKEKILTKKNIIIAASLAAAAVVIIIAAVFGKTVKPEQKEALTTQVSAQTDIVAVTITDSNGKRMVVEGVAVVDADGNATITAKDSEGNELIVKGTAQRDSSGKLTVKNPEIVGGSVIKDNQGNEILVGESNVSQVDDNNSGDIQTDVSLDDETKETIKNENNNSGNASGNTEGSNNTPAQPEEHRHVWSERTETIHHNEQGHWEDVQVGTQTVVDSEAYQEIIYNDTPIYICNCGKTFDDYYAFDYHQMHVVDLDGDWGVFAANVNPSYHPRNYDVNFKFYYEPGTYVMGSVHHEAVTHEEPVYESRYVVDKAAYDETVTTTYCAGCGAVK